MVLRLTSVLPQMHTRRDVEDWGRDVAGVPQLLMTHSAPEEGRNRLPAAMMAGAVDRLRSFEDSYDKVTMNAAWLNSGLCEHSIASSGSNFREKVRSVARSQRDLAQAVESPRRSLFLPP